MAYYTGTVTSSDAFLDEIKAKALLNGWTLANDAVLGSPLTREVYLTSSEGHVVSFKLYPQSGTSSKTMNVMMNIADSYDGGLSFHNQPGSYALENTGNINDNCCFLYRETYSAVYHLTVDSRKISCVYKNNECWLPFYVGKYLPYDTVGTYPNPYFIGGNVAYDYTILDTYDFITNRGDFDYFTITSEVYNVPAVKLSDNSWAKIKNDTSSTSNCIIPSHQFRAVDRLLPNLDGSYTLLPFIINQRIDASTRGNFLGELDGMFTSSPIGLFGGRIINDGVNDYIACPASTSQQIVYGYILMRLA